MIKLIATDIDGTLLQEGNDTINPEYYDVILKLKEKGAIFAAASGRQFPSIRNLFKPIEKDMIFIAENGAYVSCRGVDMDMVVMDRQIAEDIIKAIRKMPDCFATASAKDKMYIEDYDDKFLDLLVNGYHNHMEIVDDVLKADIDIIKISIYRGEGVSHIADSVIDEWKDKIHVTVAGEIWIDFMDYRADKGNALHSIQKKLNILPEETMVFGDNLNDVGMLKSAGESYAIGNAREEVKNVAKYIADTNENDGVLQILKTLL